jgi:hypothetical protein
MTLHHAFGVGNEYEWHRINPVAAMYLGIGNGLDFLSAHWSSSASVKMNSFRPHSRTSITTSRGEHGH